MEVEKEHKDSEVNREPELGCNLGVYRSTSTKRILRKLEKGMKPQTTIFKNNHRASLVVQWLRVHLPMQGTQVRALVWEDPTCHGAAGPVSHNY